MIFICVKIVSYNNYDYLHFYITYIAVLYQATTQRSRILILLGKVSCTVLFLIFYKTWFRGCCDKHNVDTYVDGEYQVERWNRYCTIKWTIQFFVLLPRGKLKFQVIIFIFLRSKNASLGYLHYLRYVVTYLPS